MCPWNEKHVHCMCAWMKLLQQSFSVFSEKQIFRHNYCWSMNNNHHDYNSKCFVNVYCKSKFMTETIRNGNRFEQLDNLNVNSNIYIAVLLSNKFYLNCAAYFQRQIFIKALIVSNNFGFFDEHINLLQVIKSIRRNSIMSIQPNLPCIFSRYSLLVFQF